MAEAEAGQPDAVLLAPLTEDTFVHNLHVRYKRDVIYTYVGNALVSVNPCRALPLYSAELARAYLARPPHQLPPHLYAVAAAAYRGVRDRRESQCVVITGESGAGKTEAARVTLQCALLAGGGGAPDERLAAAGTLLEAFGNAATARNHNASRFGKLLDIEFDFRGEPVGGHITHYLLEKERASGAPAGERNFHVLYQLLAGADAQLLKRLKLQRSWEHYRVLRTAAAEPAPEPEGGASPRRTPPAAADTDHFAFTKAAMATLGFGGGECGGVLRVLAFLLKLGNVLFEPQHNIDGTIGARLQHHYELAEACALVGVEPLALASALGAPPADDEDEAEPDAEWAAALRDRLLCAVYSRLFTWLVTAVNAALAPPEPGKRPALGVLDVYGFEALAHNGLERLLINYAAERVQAAVTGATLRREQEEYAREGLAWRPLAYADHELQAELLDAGPDSVLGALKECTLRRAGDAALLQRLQRRRHPRLVVSPPDRFQVLHFGGAVTYSARGMVRRNRDALCTRCGAALAAAREPLLAALFAAGSAPQSPRRPAALACRQRALVAALVRRLPPAPHLVRCLRPDALLRPHRLDAQLLRHQIRTQGIMDMALLRRAGWCESMCARALLARYGVLRAGAASSPDEEPLRAARALLRALPIPSAEFAFGRTRVFIRSPRTVSVGAGGAAGGARVGAGERGAARVAAAPGASGAAAARARRRRDRARLASAPRQARARRHAAAAAGAAAAARTAPDLGARHRRRRAVARLVPGGAAALPAGAGAAAARAARVAVRRLAAVPVPALAGPRRRAAAAAAPPLALPAVPRALRPDGAQPHAREGDRERAVPRAQGDVRAQRGAPVRGRLRAAARVGGVAARRGRGARRPVRGVRGRGGQGAALVRPRGALPGGAVDGRAAAARAALAARQAARARARRLPAVAVAAGGRPAVRARGGAARRAGARRAARARLPVRGRPPPPRRRAAAHLPRARARHQAVPRGAERGGRAAARQHRQRVRGQLRPADGDGGLPRAGRRRRAPAAPRQSHGRAALTPRPKCLSA